MHKTNFGFPFSTPTTVFRAKHPIRPSNGYEGGLKIRNQAAWDWLSTPLRRQFYTKAYQYQASTAATDCDDQLKGQLDFS
ncbi:hypothetical protein PCANC_09923 [Puccinia coronata f. sp. avenae]|uniref:Uncharacterized protein n=1 Tax=Puccinia coronata f. sp. avenae TaxID=200324 RepID=A0A2N5V2U8_9BASI|nr:hypothetical protein PCANC_17454 [Puccinia coronata f. sp. avenae]PLW44325.1 hypothetical protein PCANC_09923 [Puccinia coronata f. sp. avenae]